MSDLRRARELLQAATEQFPPTGGARPSLTIADDGRLVLSIHRRDAKGREYCATATFADTDMARLPNDILNEIARAS